MILAESFNNRLRTGRFLADSIAKGYAKGLKSVVELNKKKIAKLTGGDVTAFSGDRPLFEVDYSQADVQAIKNMKVEAMTVANVGIYELEEKLKEIAIDETGKKLSPDEFSRRARKLISEYVPLDDVPPDGYLKTNYKTALSSSFGAAQYQRLQDKSIKGLYPAYRYMTRQDSRVRPEHALLHERVFYSVDPIWQKIYPPNGWNCRCYVIPLDADEVRDLKIESPYRGKNAEEEILKQAGIDKEFRRNAGDVKSIWSKWLNSKLKEIDYNKVTNEVLDYVKSLDIKLSDFNISKEQLKQATESLGRHIPKPQKDYDTDRILVNVAPEIMSKVAEVMRKPDEVWGRTFNRGGEVNSTLHYIKFGKGEIFIAIVRNGEFAGLQSAGLSKIDEYRKGELLYKDFQ